jgi:hypothetical protein
MSIKIRLKKYTHRINSLEAETEGKQMALKKTRGIEIAKEKRFGHKKSQLQAQRLQRKKGP